MGCSSYIQRVYRGWILREKKGSVKLSSPCPNVSESCQGAPKETLILIQIHESLLCILVENLGKNHTQTLKNYLLIRPSLATDLLSMDNFLLHVCDFTVSINVWEKAWQESYTNSTPSNGNVPPSPVGRWQIKIIGFNNRSVTFGKCLYISYFFHCWDQIIRILKIKTYFAHDFGRVSLSGYRRQALHIMVDQEAERGKMQALCWSSPFPSFSPQPTKSMDLVTFILLM